MAYARARSLRKKLRLEPGCNVLYEVEKNIGFGLEHEQIVSNVPSHINAALFADDDGTPVIVGPELHHDRRVFRWARALNLWEFGCAGDSPRLVTTSHARQQRESRAFAAELLAPARELARKLGGVEVSEDDLVNLSNEFGVGSQLIRYRIENHKLAVVSEP